MIYNILHINLIHVRLVCILSIYIYAVIDVHGYIQLFTFIYVHGVYVYVSTHTGTHTYLIHNCHCLRYSLAIS